MTDHVAALNAEIKSIMTLADTPEEALYQWIDATLNTSGEQKYGGSTHDALPAYLRSIRVPVNGHTRQLEAGSFSGYSGAPNIACVTGRS